MRCLMDSVVHFPSLRNTIAVMVDVQRVLSGSPWFLNNHLLILQTIQKGENPSNIVLNFANFWFLEYDTSILTMGLKKFIRICVRLDISSSLKRKKKIQIGKKITVYPRFQYEKLSLFCFIYGKTSQDCLWLEPILCVLCRSDEACLRVGGSDRLMDHSGVMRVWKVKIRVVNGGRIWGVTQGGSHGINFQIQNLSLRNQVSRFPLKSLIAGAIWTVGP
ncbi:hypothetical protein CXB51_032867 [Gossypium anomalum]|uniref:DUF4283 domain-containing protein n=1 Tax=Gossypium anomalum TaxID=47600 RepID=A0A8J5Y3P3_9ROSI|nr:hypothetical protein CXB51_032867 [Gossypium anomalum]